MDPSINQNIRRVILLTALGVGLSGPKLNFDFDPCLGTNAGKLGVGGGLSSRSLKLKREEVEDKGPLACEGLMRAEGGPEDWFLRSVMRGALLGVRGPRG